MILTDKLTSCDPVQLHDMCCFAGSQQQVMADVGEYFMPSLDHSCHEFNTTDFNVRQLYFALFSYNYVCGLYYCGMVYVLSLFSSLLSPLSSILLPPSLPPLPSLLSSLPPSLTQSVLTDITSYIAMTTDQSSTDLCPPSACNPSPCENEGVCLTDTSAVGGYICRCVPQYTGRNCDQVVDPCTTSEYQCMYTCMYTCISVMVRGTI